MRVIKFFVIVAVATNLISCGNQKADVKTLETELDSVSYALGMDMAVKVKTNFTEAKTDLFLQGYRNTIDSTNLLLKQEDITNVLRKYFQEREKRMAEERDRKLAEKVIKEYGDNKKAGEEFLAENKTKEGVKTTASGLQYKVLKEGNGKSPKPMSSIRIHYEGRLIDGTVFDKTLDREPLAAFANQFVPGFSEGLQLMEEGSKYRFFIPQELAYKYNQRGEDIKPFSALIFDVELLEIIKE